MEDETQPKQPESTPVESETTPEKVEQPMPPTPVKDVEEKEKPLEPSEQGSEGPIDREYDSMDANKQVLHAWDQYKLNKAKNDAVTAMQMLNPRQQAFVRGYIETGNARRAYMSAYPDSSPETAGANGSRLLKKDNVLSVLRPISSMQELKVEGLVNRLIELSGPVDTHPDANKRFIPPIVNVQAISVIGKLAGLEKQEPVGNIVVQWIGLDGKPVTVGIGKPLSQGNHTRKAGEHTQGEKEDPTPTP